MAIHVCLWKQFHSPVCTSYCLPLFLSPSSLAASVCPPCLSAFLYWQLWNSPGIKVPRREHSPPCCNHRGGARPAREYCGDDCLTSALHPNLTRDHTERKLKTKLKQVYFRKNLVTKYSVIKQH